jgi:hypothetical protein
VAFRTLGELRADLQNRLGFGAAGAAAGVNAPIVDSFLYNAQVQLYAQFDWKKLTYRFDKTMGIGQTLYDYPTIAAGASADANEERILKIETNLTPTGNPSWRKLKEGIGLEHRNALVNNSWPQRYELYQQIEVIPGADVAYKLRVWYIAKLGRFSQDNDRASIDDSIVFLHALANAKAHYKQSDAAFYTNQLTSLLTQLKSKGFTRKVFQRGPDKDVEPRPRRRLRRHPWT